MSSKRNVETRSSFAQSFFQASGGSDGEQDRKPNASRRRRSSLSDKVAEAAAQVASLAFEGDEPRGSWYQDALRQSGESAFNLQDFLTDATSTTDTTIDKEVLEQYKIMAQCEAQLRVKENIGFDLQEYQEANKLTCEETTDKRVLYGVSFKKQKHRLPSHKKPSPESTKLHLEEPPLLPPCPDAKLVKQKCKRVPDLVTGVVVTSGSSSIPQAHHKVKCLACRCILQVNQRATLAKCPECNVISPASSTRR